MGRRETLLDETEISIVNQTIAPWRASWIPRLINPVYMGILAFLNLILTIIILWADNKLEWKSDNFIIIITLTVSTNMIFLAEMIINFTVLGLKDVWKNKKILFGELLIQIGFIYIIVEFFVLRKNESYYLFFSQLSLLFILRNVRICQFFIELENVRLIVETSRNISKPIMGKFLFIYLIFYVYAHVGLICFGGSLTYKSYREKCDDAPPFYYLLNFNDFSSGFVTLF